jgi:hypothetical protein
VIWTVILVAVAAAGLVASLIKAAIAGRVTSCYWRTYVPMGTIVEPCLTRININRRKGVKHERI